MFSLVIVALATAALFRLWFLFHEGLGADEATIGLMARAITHGHFSAFFWGQDYGGAEAYVVSLGFIVAGASVWVVKGTAILLFAVSAVITYFLVRRLTGSKLFGLAGAAVVWVWPEAEIWNSTRELGFRGLTLVCGLGCLLGSVRVYDLTAHNRWAELKHWRRCTEFGLLGALAGVGWWSSLEITYFLVPSVIVLAGAFLRGRSGRAGARPSVLELSVGVAASLLGALPWIWGSILNHFGSVDLSTNSGGPPAGYLERLSNFFHLQLPLILGLRLPVMVGWRRHDDNAWLHPEAISLLLYVLALIAIGAVVLLVCRAGICGVALATGLVAFPFVYSASASSSGGVDGRYGVYFIPILVAAALVAVSKLRLLQRRPEGPVVPARELERWAPVVALFLASTTVLTVVGFAQTASDAVPAVPGFTAGWGNPNAVIAAAADRLHAEHVRIVIADYWEGGDIAFVGGGAVQVVDVDLVRNGSTNAHNLAQYERSGGAWVFFAPGRTERAAVVFGSTTQGPYGLTQRQFTSTLSRLGVPYRILRLGVLDAVVPSRPVPPTAVGIPAWTYELPPATTWVQWAIANSAPR